MHVPREILRQKLALGRSHREVAASVGVSAGKVVGVFTEARSLGLDARLYPKTAPASVRPQPDCAALPGDGTDDAQAIPMTTTARRERRAARAHLRARPPAGVAGRPRLQGR